MRRFPFTLGAKRVNFFNHSAGLGNCLIPLGCALYLAAELNYRPVVFWIPDKAIGGASFGDLFETANLPFELVESPEARMTRAVLNGFRLNISPRQRMGFRLLRPLILFQYRKGIRLYSSEEAEKPARQLGPGRGFVVLTGVYFRYGCDLSWLSPSLQLTSQIVELKKRFAPDTVGIHLRGTDRPNTPPIEKIIARMRAEIELNPDVNFFLASDGDKQEEAVITLFEDRLIRAPQKIAHRFTLEGQQSAVVDLFGLAATSRIIGMSTSSFSTAAALIGNKPLLRIK